MTPCPRCGRVLAALARRGFHRWESAANEDPSAPAKSWIALHVGDQGKSDCRLGDAEAENVVNAAAAKPLPAVAA